MPTESQKAFDLDLAFGQAGEQWLLMLGSDKTKIEVKTERGLWEKTGNLAFEYRCNGKPSGIAATKSEWWAHLLSRDGKPIGGFIFNVAKLKCKLREGYKSKKYRLVDGGDGNRASMILVPISQVYEFL
jgi:hypothetical protein